MGAKIEIISVFTDKDKNFRGNPAAVIQLDEVIAEERMQELASDLNQPATTFLWPGQSDQNFNVRWFAPDGEIGVCGHGSLAAMAYLSKNRKDSTDFTLKYRSGEVIGSGNGRDSGEITLAKIPVTDDLDIPPLLIEALGVNVLALLATENKYIALVESEEALRKMKPDFAKLRQMETFGYAVTAQGDKADFVSRTLVPHVQQLEDHATGSSHAALVPYWSEILNKDKMTAHQLSPRGGMFQCELAQDKVTLRGRYVFIASGALTSV